MSYGTGFQEYTGDRSAPAYADECELFLPVTEKSLPAMKSRMEYLWRQGLPLCIEVKGQKANFANTTTLLERWLVQTVVKRPQAHHTSLHLLIQAVKSFLHFSQIRSWAVFHDGSLPFDLVCRVCTPAEENWEHFTLCKVPEVHIFPPATITHQLTLQVTVTYLPRSDSIPSLLGGGMCCHGDHLLPRPPDVPSGVSPTCVSKIGLSLEKCGAHVSRTETTDLNCGTVSENGEFSTENCASHVSRTGDETSTKKCGRLILRTGNEVSNNCGTSVSRTGDEDSNNGRTSVSRTGDEDANNCGTSIPRTGDEVSISRTGDEASKAGCDKHELSAKGTNKESSKNRTVILDSAHLPLPSRDTSHFRTMECSKVSTGSPPKASSPMPSVMIRKKQGDRTLDRTHRRSSFLPGKTPPQRSPQRSMSVPAAVPSLSLLGTFEECVLNGRIEACGYLEGFEAELAASGSFCPRHVRLPMTTAFFDLSKDVGTSPYLGHIDLMKAGKKGYHVPSKGTVQVTLFNPNKAVVKIFIVMYDLSDMPSSTQTFLRQRTLSRSLFAQHQTAAPSLPVLHYLIHLRFASSKSGRVYLHTDIRVIFARRAPDNDPDISKVFLSTLSEGPTNPKYSPIDP
ncbi:hypothetical protein EMCRGX_G030709 [Ephydatia muelleri]